MQSGVNASSYFQTTISIHICASFLNYVLCIHFQPYSMTELQITSNISKLCLLLLVFPMSVLNESTIRRHNH